MRQGLVVSLEPIGRIEELFVDEIARALWRSARADRLVELQQRSCAGANLEPMLRKLATKFKDLRPIVATVQGNNPEFWDFSSITLRMTAGTADQNQVSEKQTVWKSAVRSGGLQRSDAVVETHFSSRLENLRRYANGYRRDLHRALGFLTRLQELRRAT
jgi:hypothetical protein